MRSPGCNWTFWFSIESGDGTGAEEAGHEKATLNAKTIAAAIGVQFVNVSISSSIIKDEIGEAGTTKLEFNGLDRCR